jgi:thiol-disulfide isomerase/thioredoxin
MAFMAIAIFCLLSVAIYSLSRISSTPWTSLLKTPNIQAGVKQDLPKFEVMTEGKQPINAQYFEEKWTLITFWSFTCAPCMEEMPALNQLALTWQGPEFSVLTVNTDHAEDLDSAKRFLEEQQITLPTVYDQQQVMKNAFGVNEIPRHFLVGPDKKVVWAATGAFRWTEAKARDQLLKLMELQAPESAPDPGE